MEEEQVMFKVCQHRNVPEAFARFDVPTSDKWLADAMRARKVRDPRSAFFEVQSAGSALFGRAVQDARSAFFKSVTSMWPGTWVMQSGTRASSATD